MSDNIPNDIQEEIIKNLPIKSLIRFRLVSKQWNSFISSTKFIAEYHTQQKHKHHLLVSYQPFGSSDLEYVSILDDDTFPQHKVLLAVPTAFKLRGQKIVSSQGLLFVHCYDARSGTTKGVIWNPTIRKLVDIDVRDSYHACFGFGVCPDTYDPKIVKYKLNSCGKREFEIFTLSTNAWRRLYNSRPRECISLGRQIAIDRFMYWSASEDFYVDGRNQSHELIVSFDMTSEEFMEISYPASLAVSRYTNYLCLYNIRDSLVVVQLKYELEKPVYSVWKMMEHGVSKSFTKLYTINTTDAISHVYGFRKSGEPIAKTQNNPQRNLFAYDPKSEHINYIAIPGTRYFPSVFSYIETLLLLDHRDCSIYFDMEKDMMACSVERQTSDC